MKPNNLYMNVSTNIGDPAHQESTTLPLFPTSTPLNTLLRTKTLLYWTKNINDSIRSTRLEMFTFHYSNHSKVTVARVKVSR